MLTIKQVTTLLSAISLLVAVAARPDSAGVAPLPGPGLSYGGIPYGSMTGNVAEFFKRQAPSVRHFAPQQAGSVDYAPVEQWL